MPTPIPEERIFVPIPEEFHKARLCWVCDTGSHEDCYDGVTSNKRYVYLGFEILDMEHPEGKPIVVTTKLNFAVSKKDGSVWAGKKSNALKLWKQWFKDYSYESVSLITILRALGKAVNVMTSNTKKVNAEGKERIYAKIEMLKPGVEETTPALKANIINFTYTDPMIDGMPEWIFTQAKTCIELSEKDTPEGDTPEEITPNESATPTNSLEQDIPF